MKNWKLKFFTIWIGQAFSLFGSSLVDFSLIWWLTESTGSERILVISNLLVLLPRMFLGPFAGSLIDRTNRKIVMIAADGMIALVTIGLVILYRNDAASLPILFIVLLLRSLGSMFHQPAMKSATALLVPEEHLARIGGFNRILAGATTIVAPIAGAMLIEVFDISSVLYIDIMTAIIAIFALFLSSVPNSIKEEKQVSSSIGKETMDGMRYVFQTRSLFFVVGTCTLANFCYGPTEALKSMMVKTVFHGGVIQLSWITAASGFGLIVGGIVMSLWGGCQRNLVTSAIGWGGVGIFYAAIAFLPKTALFWLIVCMFLASIFIAIGSAGLDAFYEVNVPQEYHGRVFSVLATLDNTTVPFGLLIAACLSDVLPIRFWYFITGVLHICLFLFWISSRELKRVEEK